MPKGALPWCENLEAEVVEKEWVVQGTTGR